MVLVPFLWIRLVFVLYHIGAVVMGHKLVQCEGGKMVSGKLTWDSDVDSSRISMRAIVA